MRKLGVILLLLFVGSAFAQQPKQLSSAEIYQQIKKLNVLGNVLYLAAHPDDENTRFIAYSANEKLFNTAYLSLTRGDGGQNLIGTEIREELGIIRTQELLAARRADGGQQFFSRANDFGYSKTPEETLEIWDKDKILADVVWVIRKFRPDVIVCRFPTDGGGGHGHHTASALLGLEAFDLAADKKAYPEQLKYVDVWQPKRIVVNTGRWWNPNISAGDEGVVAEDIGKYNQLLGTSCNEIAAKSRTMHKSQGFGSTGSRGEHLEYFEHLKGEQAKESLFDGINTSWSRLKGQDYIGKFINDILDNYKLDAPEKSVPLLITLKKELKKIDNTFWKQQKIVEVDNLIKHCLGLFIEAKADNYYAVKGDSVKVDFELINRTADIVQLKSITSKALTFSYTENQSLAKNVKLNIEQAFQLPGNLDISQPYWLKKQGTLGTYNVSDQLTIGKPENDAAISFDVTLAVDGEELTYNYPLIYKWNDPVKGELYRPFVVVPPVFVNFSEELQLFSSINEREISFTIKGNKIGDCTVELKAPQGWSLSKTNFNVHFDKVGEEHNLKVGLKPSNKAIVGNLIANLVMNDKVYNRSLRTIAYDHIPIQTYMPPAKAKLVYMDIKKKGSNIGYFPGAGDKIPEALTSIGYKVDELAENDLEISNLTKYDAIVVGIRAVNVNDRFGFVAPKLLKYIEEGGTLVFQYNTRHRLKTDDFAPYSLRLSRDRVTEENAEVTFLMPEHPVLNTPNKITKADFDGWVQERGLYFPNEWNKEKYDAILSWHDKGEEAKEGSLLVAKYGKGYYVYTGISFFRELPAAVPGAYRLFVNLISLGNE